MPTTTTLSLTERLAIARRELELAEQSELSAFDAVSRARERFALEEISRREWLAASRNLSDAQEGTEGKKALVRALDRLQVQEAEARTSLERRAKAERSAAQQQAAAIFDQQVARHLAAMLGVLDELAHEHSREVTGGRPNTDAGRSHAFAVAAQAVASLASLFPPANR